MAEQIGIIEGVGKLRLDAARMVDTRVLIQGSSGSGKSWLIRLLVEKIAAKIPVLILDLEGEFVTLREQFDFVVAGEGGEVAVDVRSAALLARKLLELKLSGVVSLYELDRPKRRAYVRSFLESVMAAPRALWAPRLIVLDEAHEFAPEGSPSESKAAVIDIASRGRKRGYCLVAATQRMSKLDKDIVAELRNVFVGQTTLDVDVKRALDTLGFPADIEHKRELRSLDHQFYAMGPATSAEGVVLFKADDVKTTHPESGLRRTLSPPEPSRRIKQALGELADLPKQAEDEANDMASAKRQIAELKRQVAAKPAEANEWTTERLATAIAERDHWKSEATKVDRARKTAVTKLSKIHELSTLNGEAAVEVIAPAAVNNPAQISNKNRTSSDIPARSVIIRPPSVITGDASELRLGGGALRMIQVLADRHPAQFTEAQWATMSGLKRTGGTWGTYKSRLRLAGLIEEGGGMFRASDAAVAQYGDTSRAPQTPQEILEDWKQKLGSGSARMLDALWAGPKTRPELAAAVEIEMSGGTFGTYLSRLRSNGLINESGGQLQLSEAFN